MENYCSVFLRKNEERRLTGGHLWIFSNEIASVNGSPQNGDLVAVYSAAKVFLGIGFYNRNSLIAVRLFTAAECTDPVGIIEQRIIMADNFRRILYPERTSYRLVFSESDLLPGLIIDRFNNTYVMQVNSAGIENFADSIALLLKKNLGAGSVFTANDSHFRELEGLAREDKIFFGGREEEIIVDSCVKYRIDFAKTQKTGFFFDQAANRDYIRQFTAGKSVLDAYCNSGGFGLHALKGGAAEVTFVDISAAEIDNVHANIDLNNLAGQGNCTVICEDVFDFLQHCASKGKQFDMVMVDPPSFTKNKKGVPAALKGYEKMHRLALKVLKPDGMLVTSSCSHHISAEDYQESVLKAAAKEQMRLQLIYSAGAAPDHPILLGMPETSYLKFMVYRKLLDYQSL